MKLNTVDADRFRTGGDVQNNEAFRSIRVKTA